MPASYPIVLDARRRPTLPAELLEEAGLSGASDLVAFSEPGRIVLSTRTALVGRVREMFVGTSAAASGREELEILRRRDVDREAERTADGDR